MKNEDTLTPKDAQKWANALRSGKYKQGKRYLQSGDDYCCLGVACKIFIPKAKLDVFGSKGNISGCVPYHQQHAPEWLKRINTDLMSKLDDSFMRLNDHLDYSFDEIADIIELVYVHKALN